MSSKMDIDIDDNETTESAANKKQSIKKSRKRKFNETECCVSNSTNNSTEPPKKKKKKKRGWSESEELLFRSGLEIYGRDWNALALHVGNNRNAASIRSHAQVYFLKLLQENKSLPTKVLESGNGYTLGGAPLNKYSSIAIRHFGGAHNVPSVDGVISDEEAAKKSKRKKKPPKTAENGEKKEDKKEEKKKKKKKKKKKRNKYYDDSTDDDEYNEYQYIQPSTEQNVKRRSGRSCNRNRRIHEALHITDPYGLRTDIEYYNKHEPAPFIIKYCPNSLLIADIHSHLCLNVEIMGLLGGKYDIDNHILYILKCYPLREEEPLCEQSVSADPSHHLQIIDKMRDIDNLQLVGWYHSHPNFDNYPSNTDCHQHFIHKYENELINPYIGLIISSWSTTNIISAKSDYRFFNSIKEFDQIYTPLQFESNWKIYKNINNDNNDLLQQIKELINVYSNNKYDIYRSDFGGNWNNMSREEKILKSIRAHVQFQNDNDNDDDDDDDDDIDQIEIFIKKIHQLFREKSNVWWVTNKPNINKENKNCLNL